MHLVNKNYIKITGGIYGIYIELASSKGRTAKFWQKMLNIASESDKTNYGKDIYISINNLIDPTIFDISKLGIERESILNASLIALYNNELEIARNLSFFFKDIFYTAEELGDLADYVLENSMSIEEYLCGNSSKYIYKENKNKIELGYIFDDDKATHKSKNKVPKND